MLYSPRERLIQSGKGMAKISLFFSTSLQSSHMEIAEITGKVILKGEGNFISVWNPTKYKEYRRKILEDHRKSFTSLDYQR